MFVQQLIEANNKENIKVPHHFDGLVQDRRNSSALAMELCLSCISPLICPLWVESTSDRWIHHTKGQ